MASTYLIHYGIKGQKWGIRRYQNPDGSLTTAGKIRYGTYYTSHGSPKRLQSTVALKGQSNMYKDTKKYVKRTSPFFDSFSKKKTEAHIKEYYDQTGMTNTYERDKAAYNYLEPVRKSQRKARRTAVKVGTMFGVPPLISSPIGGIAAGTVTGIKHKKDYVKWKEETLRIVDELMEERLEKEMS